MPKLTKYNKNKTKINQNHPKSAGVSEANEG